MAEKWAIAHSWDNNLKSYKYNNFSVIKANISVEENKFLDLTSDEGKKIFNYIRNRYIKKLEECKKRMKESSLHNDAVLINDFVEYTKIELDIVKSEFYIKFSEERIYKVNSRIPNCEVMAVKNLDCIDKNSLIVEKEGCIL